MTNPALDAGADLQQNLPAIAAFLPVFEAPAFRFGYFKQESAESGIIELPYVTLSGEASAFVETAYRTGFVLSFDWLKWAGTKEARRLRDQPSVLAAATVEQLAKLLTVVVRQDRFIEGELLAAFDSGHLTAIVRRAAALIGA